MRKKKHVNFYLLTKKHRKTATFKQKYVYKSLIIIDNYQWLINMDVMLVYLWGF